MKPPLSQRPATRIRARLAPLWRRAERRLPSLTRWRRPEPLPIRLDRRRIYIVPTRFGFIFAAMLLVMLLGALNYNNNAALLLTCVLGAAAIGSMLHTFRALDQLQMESVHAGTAQAGDPLTLTLGWQAPARAHAAIELHLGATNSCLSLAAGVPARVQLRLQTSRRGWMELPRIRVQSRWPFGFFRAWSWLAPAHPVLVYPRAEDAGPPPPPVPGDAARRRRPDGDDWAGLREYRSGDPRRHIAWKASARGQALRVKTFDRATAEHHWDLAWERTGPGAREARIARLARWVREANAAGREWSLRLPGRDLGRGAGAAHFHACMRALAELP